MLKMINNVEEEEEEEDPIMLSVYSVTMISDIWLLLPPGSLQYYF